jgi:outer membrane receptor for ferrienterochelin and colicin
MRIATRLTSLAFLLAAPGLFAQETQSSVVGNVKDVNGKALSGARVKLTSPKLLGERLVVTGADGSFRVPLLPPGNYDLAVTAEGYLGSKSTFYLSASITLRQDMTLRQLRTESATVEVVAVAAQVDKTETTAKSSFSADSLLEIRGTATGGSVAYNALLLAPSTVGTLQYASVRGAGQMGTQYVVNGTSSRDNVTGQARLGDNVLDDTIEDTAVILSPLNAKYGNTSGGIVSVVTKRGTNEFQGTFRAKLNSAAWGAQTIPFLNRRAQYSGTVSPRGTDQLSRSYEITASGPIVKDYVTFAYGTRLVPSVPNTATALNILGTFSGGQYNGNAYVRLGGTNYLANPYNAGQLESAIQKNTFHQFTLFWQVNPSHQFEYNYTQAKDENPDLQFNYVTPDANIMLLQTTFRQYYSLAYKGIIGSNQLIEVRYGLNRSNTQFPSGPGIPLRLNSGPAGGDTRSIWANGNTYFVGGAPSDTQPDKRATQSILANWNLVVDFKGQHTIDVGFEQQQPIWGTVSRNNSYPNQFWGPGQISPNDPAAVTAGVAGKYIVFPYNTNIDGGGVLTGTYLGMMPTYQQFFGADQGDVKNPTTALYVNDLWTLNNNWSVMGGFRFEKMKIEDAIGTRVNTSMMVSPRFEVKWDITGDQSRLVNFSYGQFRGLYNARFYRSFTEGRRNNQATWYWNKNNPATGLAEPYAVSYAEFTNPANYGYLAGLQTAAAYDIDSNWKPDVAHEFTVGYRRSFSAGGYWRATFIHREWKDLTNSRPIPQDLYIDNVAVSGGPQIRTYKRILYNDPEAKREYNGLEFEWNAPINAWLTFAGNYTYGRAVANNTYGDATGFAAIQTFSDPGWWRDGFRAQGYGSNTFEPMGEVPNSINHVVKTFLTARFGTERAKSTLSLLARYYSAPKVSLTNGISLSSSLLPGNPDPLLPTAVTYFWNGRGQHSTLDTYAVDLQYNFDLVLRGKLRFFSQMSVVNVLNHMIPNTLSRDAAGTGSAASYLWGYRNASTFRYGMPTGTGAVSGARGLNIDLGFKF